MVTDYRGHRRTLFACPRNYLKAFAHGIRTQNLPADQGIEPGCFWQTVPVSVHSVSVNWATEAGCFCSIDYSIMTAEEYKM